MENTTIIMWIIGQVVVAAAIWGGIRADIKSFHARLDRVESRLDAHIAKGKQ